MSLIKDSSLLSGSMHTLSGQEWRKMRIHFEPPLSFNAISRRVPRFEREIKTWTKNLDTGLVNSQLTFQLVVFRMLVLHLYEDAYDDRVRGSTWEPLPPPPKTNRALRD